MEKTQVLQIVATEPKPGTEAKFNKWYNEEHIPLAIKFKGMQKISRYKVQGENKQFPTYLAFYYFESKEAADAYGPSPEFAAVRKNKEETWKDDAYDMKWNVRYELIKTWQGKGKS